MQHVYTRVCQCTDDDEDESHNAQTQQSQQADRPHPPASLSHSHYKHHLSSSTPALANLLWMDEAVRQDEHADDPPAQPVTDGERSLTNCTPPPLLPA